MRKFRHHKYTWVRPFDTTCHRWELVGPRGALHLSVQIYEKGADREPACGLEFHYWEPPEHAKDSAPDHVHCALTGGRCWHDGTSLYARETIWPMIEYLVRIGDHATIFCILERELVRVQPALADVDSTETAA